jgi:hypothetical protein
MTVTLAPAVNPQNKHVTLTLKLCQGSISDWNKLGTTFNANIAPWTAVFMQPTGKFKYAQNAILTQPTADTYNLEFDLNNLDTSGSIKAELMMKNFFADTRQPCPNCAWVLENTASLDHGC